LQLGLSRLRSEVGRMLLTSPPGRRREEEERRRRKEEEERRRKKRGESSHPLFQEMRRPLGHSVSLPVGGGRRKVDGEMERRVRGRQSLPGTGNLQLPSASLSSSKQKLHRTDAQAASSRPARTFAFDDGQLSVHSSESEASEHIYEEIKEQSSEEEEEESSGENESFMLSISLERRNNLKLYGCLDWDFKPVSH